MMTDDEERGFQVRDRRRFTESGEPRDEAAEAGSAEAGSSASEPPAADDRPDPASEAMPESGLPITFSTFLVSLSTQALACLGDLAGPEGETPQPDLLAAREMIDIVGMLREKTTGNLDPAEANLLDGILYDLRMRYVKKVRR
jgi:hypothetical protein